MPISQFSEGLQRVISFLPGTYGTSLLRNHAMRGVMEAMRDEGVPEAMVTELRDMVDCNLYFFEKSVPAGAMYAVLGGAVVILIGVYVLLNARKIKKGR